MNHSSDKSFTYRDVGVTREGRTPAGFRTLRVHTRLGAGPTVFAAAAQALLEWRMHRALGVTLQPGADRAAPGVPVTVGLGVGRLRVYGRCRVVWAESGTRRAGWAYGTLPGHPVCGEEAFLVTREPAEGAGERGGRETVWLTVTVVSRPAVWWTRAAGPLVPLFQWAYARCCGRVLRRIASGGDPPHWTG